MSVVSNVVPIHDEQMISYPYGVIDSGYSCGWHTGVDLVPHGSTENYPLLYGCVASRYCCIYQLSKYWCIRCSSSISR